jgi:hypothetical protein
MAERIDEARLIAWIDGELTPEEATRVEQAVAADAELRALADTHRALKLRFGAAFAPIAQEPVALPPSAEVISLAAVRSARSDRTPPARRWWVPGTIAASLVVGLLIGRVERPVGVGDRTDALALAPPLARALDRQLAGERGPLRVALSFRAHDGAYCRSFTATYVDGVACRARDGWQLRYAAPSHETGGDYRMAGTDPAQAGAIAAMIAGDPLDAAGERLARDKGWR